MFAVGVPQALWLLLLVPAVILLHMLRARREPQTVSSTLLWERTARELHARLPVRRLERSLLLLLQILAVTLLALALARPTLTMPGVAGPALVMVFDKSLSMQARDVPPSRLAAAQVEALAAVDRLGRGQRVMIVEAGAGVRILAEFSGDRRGLTRTIRGLEAGDGPADVEGAVRIAAAQRVEGRPARVLVYTDRPGPPLAGVTYRIIGGAADNLALTRAAARADGAGRTAVLAEIRNFGSAARVAAVRITWPDGSGETRRLRVPAGEAVTRVWPARGDGVARLALEPGDVLPADDRAEVVVGTAARARVLLVTRGNPFLEAAFRALPLRRLGRTSAFDPAGWTGYDLVVLDRPPPLALPPGRYLIIGGLPANLPAEARGVVRGVTVTRVAGLHPVLRLIDLSGIRVDEALALRPRGGAVLAEGQAPLLWAVERPELRALLLPFDLARSDLPMHPAFPLLMANALEWLAPPPVYAAGSAPVLPAPAPGPARLIDPSGKATALTAREGALLLPPLDRAGTYRVRAGGQERLLVVTTAAEHEGDLRAAAAAVPSAAPAPSGLRQVEFWTALLVVVLGVLLLEWILWQRTQPAPSLAVRRRARRPFAVLRVAALAALVLALVGVEITRAGRDLAVVFALDLSDSVPAEERERGLALIRGASAAARPGDRFGLVAFGRDALVTEGLTRSPAFPLTGRPDGTATDIGRAIRTALGLLPPQGGRRLVVLTDGRDTTGGGVDAAALAAANGAEIGVVPLGGDRQEEVRVDQVRVPDAVRVGERFDVQVWMEADSAARGTLGLFAGGQEVGRRPLTLRPGRALIRFAQQAQTPGTLTYEARLDAAPDGLRGNNRGHGVVTVHGPAAVLYVAAQPGPLPAWLRAQGIVVRPLAPEALPTTAVALAGVPAVILDDVPATVLSPAQMRALRDYVSVMGGGLVAVGGPHAFGVGGYAGTDLEAVLPVSMDVRHRVAIPSTAVMLVLDASGSMGSFGPELAKIELAKEAAQSVVDLLGERDVIGVIAFDQEPHWLVRPTQARQREQILAQVSRLAAGGGTNLYPALVEAHRALQRVEAKVKHVIILSDGQTDPGDFERHVRRMARAKITVSSVAIGADADREIMRNLAAWGRGRHYFTRDLYTIPQIFTAEAVLATRAYLVEEPFRPVASPASALIRGLGPLPVVRGYVATAPKAAATLHLLSPRQDPLLASWQHGLGRAVAFTSDAAPRWTREWFAWPEAAHFWSRLVRWTIAPAPSLLDVRAVVDQEAARPGALPQDELAVAVEARDIRGELLTDLNARARVSGRDDAVPLRQTAPGRYEGRLPLPAPGAYIVSVEGWRGGRVVGAGRTSVTVPYPAELRGAGLDQAALARLVEAGRGRVIQGSPDMVSAPAHGGARRQPAWPVLTTLALGLFVAEAALRRAPILREMVAKGAAGLLAWVRRTPEPTVEMGAEDQRYEGADRWGAAPSEVESAGAGMEQAARLYIARLRQQQESRRD